MAWGVEQIVRRGSRALLDLERASWRAVRGILDDIRAGTGAAARVHRRRSHEPIVRCNGGLRRVVEGFKAATKHI